MSVTACTLQAWDHSMGLMRKVTWERLPFLSMFFPCSSRDSSNTHYRCKHLCLQIMGKIKGRSQTYQLYFGEVSKDSSLRSRIPCTTEPEIHLHTRNHRKDAPENENKMSNDSRGEIAEIWRQFSSLFLHFICLEKSSLLMFLGHKKTIMTRSS